MFTTLFLILIVLAAASLLWWGITKLSLPPTVSVVVQVAFGLICLWFIYTIFVNGGNINVGRLR
jgi:intracellular septation protein A